MSSHSHISHWRRIFTSPAARSLFAAAAFMAAVLISPPSSPSAVGKRPQGPSADEARVLDELTRWVLEGGARVGLPQSVRERERSFELFRRYAGDDVRRDLVASLPYGEAIWRVGRRWGVDPLLLAAMVEAESNFNPDAVSVQGAVGLLQVLPETAALYRPASDPMDPAVNLEVGARYVAEQLRAFEGDLPLALAAYNSGPGNVARFAGIPPFAETRHYVRRVLAIYIAHLQRSWQGLGDLDWLVVES